MIGLLLPVADDFGLSAARAGLLMTLYAASYAILSPLLVSVTGGQAVVLLDNHDDAEDNALVVRPDIGTLLKVDTPSSVILGLVSASSAPMPTNASDEAELRVVEMEFIGELLKGEDGMPSGFKRGVSRYPPPFLSAGPPVSII